MLLKSQHHRLIKRWVGSIDCLAKPSKANSTPCRFSLSLSFSQKSTCTKVTHLDDVVPDSISSLMVSSRAHTPKTFSCTFMHIHLFRSSLLKIGDARPWVYDTRTCNHFEHENQSNLSGVVTTASPFTSPRSLTTRRCSWLDLWWTWRVEWIQRSIETFTPFTAW
jgi:hypothetical protein